MTDDIQVDNCIYNDHGRGLYQLASRVSGKAGSWRPSCSATGMDKNPHSLREEVCRRLAVR